MIILFTFVIWIFEDVYEITKSSIYQIVPLEISFQMEEKPENFRCFKILSPTKKVFNICFFFRWISYDVPPPGVLGPEAAGDEEGDGLVLHRHQPQPQHLRLVHVFIEMKAIN